MENVTIVSGRENVLEFDINIQGANKKEPIVRFVVEKNPVHYTIQCQHGEGESWTATVPVIIELKNKAYPFRIEVIVDGYYFEPFRGTANVIAEPDVKTKEVHIAQPAKPVVSSVSVKNDDTKSKKKKATTTKPKIVPQKTKKEVKEEINIAPIQVEIPLAPEPTEDFKSMADRWLNREKPMVTEKDKTVKNIIKDLVNPVVAVETDIQGMDEYIDDIVNKIKEDEAKDPNKSEKNIKVQAILKSFI